MKIFPQLNLMKQVIVLWKKVFYYQKLAEIEFTNEPFIYLVTGGNPATGRFRVLETSIIEKISCHLAYSERRHQWRKLYPNNNLWICVLPVPEWSYTWQDRTKIIRKLNKICKPAFCEIENSTGMVQKAVSLRPAGKKFFTTLSVIHN